MTLHPRLAPQQRGPRRRSRRVGYVLLTLLLAIVIAVATYFPFAAWGLRWSRLEYVLSWLLAPSSGVLSLALVLGILFWVPRLLQPRTRGRQPLPEDDAAAATGQPTPSSTPEQPGEAEEEQLEIPAMTFREMGAEHRWELAKALGIPWRDELIHDHQSWAIACLDAAQRRAAEPYS